MIQSYQALYILVLPDEDIPNQFKCVIKNHAEANPIPTPRRFSSPEDAIADCKRLIDSYYQPRKLNHDHQ